MSNWEEIFKVKGKFFHEPHKDTKKIILFMKQNKIRRVLDLGCGSGRHTVLLAKEGFEVFGLDNSESGLKYTQDWLKENNLKASLIKADCYKKFPYKDNFFDAIISIQVIHHGKISDIKFCISEIERTLKPNGLVFITVPKTKKNKFRSQVKMIAPRTFIPLNGHEVGLPHYLFTKELLKNNFKNFQILDLHTDILKHYCLLGKSKKT
jgi:ubiquinone/menaquinone biosynthesis C-methylase UbiE